MEYAYDAKGQRTGKRLDGQCVAAYRWLDPLCLLEFHDGAQWWRLAYDLERGGRTPVGVTNGQESFRLFADHLGTPLALADLDGNIVQTMRYDAFGNLLEALGHAAPLPLGFAGGLFDADTGLTRFVWRDYDSDTGRFTALDPLGAKGGDIHPRRGDWYGYCVNDPVNRVDVWGLEESPYDFGGEGRTPLDGPKYGKHCGKNWTGGWNPKQHGGTPGPFASVDSADEKCRFHDFCYTDCASQGNPGSCISTCDDKLVRDLKTLPEDSSLWERQPPPGKEDQAEAIRDAAIWWFKQ